MKSKTEALVAGLRDACAVERSMERMRKRMAEDAPPCFHAARLPVWVR